MASLAKLMRKNERLGYKVVFRVGDRLVSKADARQTAPAVIGSELAMHGKGVFLSPSREYVLAYYSDGDDAEYDDPRQGEVLLTLAFDPRQITSGNLTDRDSEVSVRSARILAIEPTGRRQNPARRFFYAYHRARGVHLDDVRRDGLVPQRAFVHSELRREPEGVRALWLSDRFDRFDTSPGLVFRFRWPQDATYSRHDGAWFIKRPIPPWKLEVCERDYVDERCTWSPLEQRRGHERHGNPARTHEIAPGIVLTEAQMKALHEIRQQPRSLWDYGSTTINRLRKLGLIETRGGQAYPVERRENPRERPTELAPLARRLARAWKKYGVVAVAHGYGEGGWSLYPQARDPRAAARHLPREVDGFPVHVRGLARALRDPNPVYRFPSGELVEDESTLAPAPARPLLPPAHGVAVFRSSEAARRLFQQASQFDKTPGEPMWGGQEEDDEQAEKLYLRALYLDPTLADAYNNLGRIYYARGDGPTALPWFLRAIETDPRRPEFLFNAGLAVWAERGRDDTTIDWSSSSYAKAVLEAEGYFERAIAADPRDEIAYIYLANALAEHHNQLGLRAVAKKYLQMFPGGTYVREMKQLLAKIEKKVIVHATRRKNPAEKQPWQMTFEEFLPWHRAQQSYFEDLPIARQYDLIANHRRETEALLDLSYPFAAEINGRRIVVTGMELPPAPLGQMHFTEANGEQLVTTPGAFGILVDGQPLVHRVPPRDPRRAPPGPFGGSGPSLGEMWAHERVVQAAIARGDRVPKRVLKRYPDLARLLAPKPRARRRR